MGNTSSLCLSDACTQETHDEAPFTKSLDFDSPKEAQRGIQQTDTVTATNVDNSDARILAGSPQSSSSYSSDTESQQSVLTAISPTKDRPPTPVRTNPVTAGMAPPPLDLLFVKTVEDEHVDKWSDVRRLVQEGELRALVDYAAENKISLQNVRFEDTLQTVLHVAVLYNHADLVRFFIQTGVNINLQDKDGMTAIALAFRGGNNEIISTLTNTKALEFAGSPYSPYALTLVSGLTSLHSKTSASAPYHTMCPSPSAPPAAAAASHEGHTPFPEASPISSLGWESARQRSFSTETSRDPDRRRLTLNSPITGYRPPLPFPKQADAVETSVPFSPSAPSGSQESGQMPPDSVQRRMTLVGQALEQLVSMERQRSLSLPAGSPTFAAARAGGLDAPLSLLPPTSYSADHTPLDGNSPRSTLTGGDTTISGATTGLGLARPPLGKQKPRKPITARLRKAAGRAMSMIVPTARGMPPRPATPVPTPPATAAVFPPAQHTRSASGGSTTLADDAASSGLTEELYGNSGRVDRVEHSSRPGGIAMEH